MRTSQIMCGGDQKSVVDSPVATLSGTGGHIQTNLAKCHEMLDVIESGLFGPACNESGIKEDKPAGLEGSLCGAESSSASLAIRIEQIASRI